MISRFGNQNFFVAHYEWLAVGFGVLALAVGGFMYFSSLSVNQDDAVSESVAAVKRLKPSDTGVQAVKLESFQNALRQTRSPAQVPEITGKSESFLASERRVACTKCKKAIPGDVKVCPACPYCGTPQAEEVKVVLDHDNDGLPDEWEKKYGFNVNDAADAAADQDKDGFTNLEEFTAKTDPTDSKDHPDYLDSLKLVLPLKETRMPFAFTKATPIRDGWRCEFVDPTRKTATGQPGRRFTVLVGQPVIDAEDAKNKFDYGFKLKKYERKHVRTEKKGMKGMFIDNDVSEVTLERKSDGKIVCLQIQSGRSAKNLKLAPVDIQATLNYERGSVQTFNVVPGNEINLNGTKYRIADIRSLPKGAKVVIEPSIGGKKRTLEALEQ